MSLLSVPVKMKRLSAFALPFLLAAPALAEPAAPEMSPGVRLVDHGILTREALPEDRRKIEYRLTDKGAALLPTMVALRQWGERWETGCPATPILVDARDGLPIGQVEVRAHDGRVLTKRDLHWALPEDLRDDEPEARAAE